MYTIDGVILFKDLYKDLPVTLREDTLNILHSAHHSVGPKLSRTMSTYFWLAPQQQYKSVEILALTATGISFNWDSFHARLSSYCKAWSYKKKKHKKIKAYWESV